MPKDARVMFGVRNCFRKRIEIDWSGTFCQSDESDEDQFLKPTLPTGIWDSMMGEFACREVDYRKVIQMTYGVPLLAGN